MNEFCLRGLSFIKHDGRPKNVFLSSQIRWAAFAWGMLTSLRLIRRYAPNDLAEQCDKYQRIEPFLSSSPRVVEKANGMLFLIPI